MADVLQTTHSKSRTKDRHISLPIQEVSMKPKPSPSLTPFLNPRDQTQNNTGVLGWCFTLVLQQVKLELPAAAVSVHHHPYRLWQMKMTP